MGLTERIAAFIVAFLFFYSVTLPLFLLLGVGVFVANLLAGGFALAGGFGASLLVPAVVSLIVQAAASLGYKRITGSNASVNISEIELVRSPFEASASYHIKARIESKGKKVLHNARPRISVYRMGDGSATQVVTIHHRLADNRKATQIVQKDNYPGQPEYEWTSSEGKSGKGEIPEIRKGDSFSLLYPADVVSLLRSGDGTPVERTKQSLDVEESMRYIAAVEISVVGPNDDTINARKEKEVGGPPS
jgi:hypothetical protein